MVNCSAGPEATFTENLCGAGVSPPAEAVKSRVSSESRRPGEARRMGNENGLVTLAFTLSVTRITNEKEPVFCGVPLRTPVDGLRVRPAGSVPDSRAQV